MKAFAVTVFLFAAIACPLVAQELEPIESALQFHDPYASGAVGPHHMVIAHVSGVIVQSRTGGETVSLTNREFWDDPDLSVTLDRPDVAYDATADRWVMTLEGDRLAVSESGDPTAGWRRYRIGIGGLIRVVSSDLALTADTVVVASDIRNDNPLVMFPTPTTTYVFTVQKTDLYALPATLRMTMHVPLEDDRILTPMAGESDVEYLIDGTEGPLLFNRVDTITGPWMVIPLPIPWSFATFNPDIAVERNGFIHFAVAQAVMAGRWSILWGRLDPQTRQIETGTIDDPTGLWSHEPPSLAVNDRGVMVIAFTTVSTTTRKPAAAYVIRDAFGQVTAPILLRDQDGSPLLARVETVVVDPADDSVFWMLISADGLPWLKIDTGASRRRTVRK
jgi:hypothetical protein